MKLNEKSALNLWHGTLVATVRQDSPDLSARQMAVLLTVYITDAPHTVRGLSKMLNVSKPAITRALDKLSDLDLLKRQIDQSDKRNVLVQRTPKGTAFLKDFAGLVQQVADTLPEQIEAADFQPSFAKAA